MKFLYEIAQGDDHDPVSGEIEAHDEDHAKRLLSMQFELPTGSPAILLSNLTEMTVHQAEVRSSTLRYLLETMRLHHNWMDDPAQGEKAELTGLDLSGVNLKGQNLEMVRMAGSDLTGCDFSGARMAHADLSGSDLRDANFKGANLRDADLSDADLRGANFTDADLTRVDVWRANLPGAVIDPASLHRALGCTEEG